MQKTDNLKNIPVQKVRYNPRNDRSMIPDEVFVIASSIAKNGLLQPLVAFKEGDIYILLAGHRRLAAIKMVNDMVSEGSLPSDSIITEPIVEVPVVIVPKPEDEFAEQEILSEANIFRRSQKDLAEEVIKAQSAWNAMDPVRKKKCREILLEKFKMIHRASVTYSRDPEGFIRNNFRASDEYVRFTTGIYLARSTMQNIRKSAAKTEEDTQESESSIDAVVAAQPKESEAVLDAKLCKQICKNAQSLAGLLPLVEIDDENFTDIRDRCIDSLETLTGLLA